MELNIAVGGLSALAHEGRLAVYRLLVQAGPEGVAAGEIARRLQVPPNSLSANLNILNRAGLVRSRREGRSIVYSAHYAAMSSLLAFLVEDCCQGSAEVCTPLFETLTAAACCAPAGRA